MWTTVMVFGANRDRSIGVHFDTNIRHRRSASRGELFTTAVARMAAFLGRHDPDVLGGICSFEVEAWNGVPVPR